MGRRTGPALAVAALLALAGCGTGSGEAEADSVRSTDAEVLACTELVAEGTVLRVTPGEGPDRVSLRMEVDRYLKGERGDRRLTLSVDRDEEGEPELAVGSRVLVRVGLRPWRSTFVHQGEDIALTREWVRRALPRSRSLRCGEQEYEWRQS
ncbi:hypothetical protein OG539_16920 [Actinacidiphila glaucinigra]|uniref:hypothetical protein n=1 Tax=Actinacidiphila glaucinigra TaxID=235986 RepID=UPI002DDA65EE|nr:hypothetical protein [Actinacidiphila glaucinigra]WSD62075.1 hypothetical protein OIE69_25875 [Actinacidiphila glaucinigra]